jgi:hypothetical protein
MRRVTIVLVVALAAGVAARVAAPAPKTARFSAALACGVQRWSVKTLKDRPYLSAPRPSSVARLSALPAPAHLGSTRLPAEHQVVTVVAPVILDRSESDLDRHLILRSGRQTMIAETPSPLCTKGATPARRAQMAAARGAARVCARARVTGVVFFDFRHGQTGVAVNGVELHPVLGFTCLSG